MAHRRRRRRWPLLALAGIGVAVVLGAAAWYDLARARAALSDARDALVALADDPASLRTQDGRRAAVAEARRAQDRMARAGRRLRHSLPLRALGVVPGLSTQRRGAVELVDDAGSGAYLATRLLAAVELLATQEQVRDGAVPLEGLRRMRAHVAGAAEDVARLTGPVGGLWGPLGDARRTLNRTATATAGRLRGAAEGIGAVEGLLGGAGPRRHVIAVQNNAEMRDQGMVLSYALARAEGGRLVLERSGPITDLTLDRPIAHAVPEGTAAVFGGLAPNRLWQSVNATADFSWSGRAMAEMAQMATGQAVEGVIALDVPGLAALLRVVGPVAVPGVAGPIDADNAADVLLNRLYAGFPRFRQQGERKERLDQVAAALVERLATGSHDAVRLGSELASAAATGHLRLWSAEAGEQAAFERSGLSGGPGLRSPERTIHVSVQNATAAKLDYFVKPRLELSVALTPQGAAVVDAEVVVVNAAPADAPASYQFGPDGYAQTRPGQYITRVYFWGPRGADQPGSVAESGLRLNQGPATVEAGRRASVRFRTVIPRAVRDGRLELRLVPQPRVEPMALRVTLSAPGWDVDGPRTRAPAWDRPLTVAWDVER